jgi:hypothetical protein
MGLLGIFFGIASLAGLFVCLYNWTQNHCKETNRHYIVVTIFLALGIAISVALIVFDARANLYEKTETTIYNTYELPNVKFDKAVQVKKVETTYPRYSALNSKTVTYRILGPAKD